MAIIVRKPHHQTRVSPLKAYPFEEELQFLRALIARPRGVGAVAPSSPSLARAIAAQIDPAQPGPVLELGPGTGALTREILARGISPERLTLIEYDTALAKSLAEQFSGVHIIQGDAFDLEASLGNRYQPFIAVVSGIPLLNYPLETRRALLDSMFERMAPGAPIIQFSYGLHSPVAQSADMSATMTAFVWKNVPPARVWVYRKR
jgi:phosphatidylethanolamine/phosphatidyl-N-methylethanolamine N-methyltransferase